VERQTGNDESQDSINKDVEPETELEKFYILIASVLRRTVLDVKGFVLLIMIIRERSNRLKGGRSFQEQY
jgi:hypothetical protein